MCGSEFLFFQLLLRHVTAEQLPLSTQGHGSCQVALWTLLCPSLSVISLSLHTWDENMKKDSLLGPWTLTATAAKSLQSCPTLCDPIDVSPRGSPIPGILQARTLEWVAMSFSNAGKWKVRVKSLSRVWLLATPWTAAHQAPPIHGIFQARVLEWVAIAFSIAIALPTLTTPL